MPRRRRSARVVEDAASLPRRAAPVSFPRRGAVARTRAAVQAKPHTADSHYRLLWLSAARIEEGDECGDAGARAARSGPTAHRRELTRAECGGTRRRGRARTARPRAPDRHTDTKAGTATRLTGAHALCTRRPLSRPPPEAIVAGGNAGSSGAEGRTGGSGAAEGRRRTRQTPECRKQARVNRGKEAGTWEWRQKENAGAVLRGEANLALRASPRAR
ncbi:hypothetical protein ERJ75_000806200 [Trypanosoma vivax]|nr:hypothetical protein ERJ75_000806200 [Trypanosoma vivax]